MTAENNAKLLLLKLAIVIIVTVIFLMIFDYFLAPLIHLKTTTKTNIHILIVIFATGVLLYILKDLSKILTKYLGPHLAGLLTFIFEIIIITIGTLVILSIIKVSLTTILVSGGIAAIVVGLAISTLASNLISGAFIYAAFPIKVGDKVFINNLPGVITKITTIYTSVKTEGGTELIIPNSALVQGFFLIAKGDPGNKTVFNYKLGDDIFIPALNMKGRIRELNEFVTEIQTEKGVLLLPSYSVLTGGTFLAKQTENIGNFSIKINRNAENVKQALEEAGARVEFSSIDGDSLEFTVTYKFKTGSEAEEKSRLINIAYTAKNKGGVNQGT